MTQYNRAKNSLNELEASTERYLTLLTQTYRDEDNVPIDETEEDSQDGLQILIDKNLESISGYTTKFHDIRRANLETFRVIDTMLNPIKRKTVR